MLTPKRPDATCLIFERARSSREARRVLAALAGVRAAADPVHRDASVSCASRESEPSDIAPVEKRLTISSAGSTSSSGIAAVAGGAEAQQAAQRRAARRVGVDGRRVLS